MFMKKSAGVVAGATGIAIASLHIRDVPLPNKIEVLEVFCKESEGYTRQILYFPKSCNPAIVLDTRHISAGEKDRLMEIGSEPGSIIEYNGPVRPLTRY